MYSVIARNEGDEFGFVAREDTCDEGVIREVVEDDVYGLRYIKDSDLDVKVVVDVGGHVGSFTRLAAGLWPDATFHTFEANPNNWGIIAINMGSITSECTLHRAALVGEVPQNARLQIEKGRGGEVTGGWGINFSETAHPVPSDADSIELTSFVTVKQLIGRGGLVRNIDLLKLDCEGSEFSIINSMTDAQLSKVKCLVAEIHCGSLVHAPITWKRFRARILRLFHCPELEAREVVKSSDLFNIRAFRK